MIKGYSQRFQGLALKTFECCAIILCLDNWLYNALKAVDDTQAVNLYHRTHDTRKKGYSIS